MELVDGKAVAEAGSHPQGNSLVPHARGNGVYSKSGRKNQISSAAPEALALSNAHSCFARTQPVSVDDAHLGFEMPWLNVSCPFSLFAAGPAFKTFHISPWNPVCTASLFGTSNCPEQSARPGPNRHCKETLLFLKSQDLPASKPGRCHCQVHKPGT